jgi:hypothetical protein
LSDTLRQTIVSVRFNLGGGDLGFVGATAIFEQLQRQMGAGTPSVRTIARIIAQEGLQVRKRRLRTAPPPPGWYLPRLAARLADLDSCDVVEDLRLEGGPLFQVLTLRAQWQAAAAAWPALSVGAAHTCQSLLGHWRKHGLPTYAQFDNGTIFQGGHNWPDTFGQVTRFCLALGVSPVFAPQAEHGVQNLIEHFNGLWQQKVWLRFHHPSLREVQQTSDRFISAWCARRVRSTEAAPSRPALPTSGQLDLRVLSPGTVIYLRRCDDAGHARVLGHDLPISAAWAHRLTRIEIDLSLTTIRCYGLRRNAPFDQPLLFQCPYLPRPRKTFQAPLTSIIWH